MGRNIRGSTLLVLSLKNKNKTSLLTITESPCSIKAAPRWSSAVSCQTASSTGANCPLAVLSAYARTLILQGIRHSTTYSSCQRFLLFLL